MTPWGDVDQDIFPTVISVADIKDKRTRDAWWHEAVGRGAIATEQARMMWHAQVGGALRAAERMGSRHLAPDLYRRALLDGTYDATPREEEIAWQRIDELESELYAERFGGPKQLLSKDLTNGAQTSYDDQPLLTQQVSKEPSKDRPMVGPDGRPRENSYAREILAMLRGDRDWPPKMEGLR